MNYGHYFTQQERDRLWEKIHTYPKRVQDEILQRMFMVAEEAIETAAIDECESPIEQIMGIALSDKIFRIMDYYALPIHLVRQAKIEIGSNKTYRVDFLVDIWVPPLREERFVQIAVECDGHEFHEKTKEQAQRDKSRDRDLQAEGITVLRFTGSEIWLNPRSCADEVGRVILRLANIKERY